jgi:hypothetical protein
MLGIAVKLDESIALLAPHLSEEDYSNYRGAVGDLMGRMLIEFLNPRYKQYPSLKPEQLD